MDTERLNPLNDYIFLKIMGEKGDEEQLLAFLNAVLKRPGKQLRSLEIIENKAIPADIIGGKSCVLDVRAVLENDDRVEVEVQLLSEISDNNCYPRKNIIRVDYVKSIGERT